MTCYRVFFFFLLNYSNKVASRDDCVVVLHLVKIVIY